MGRTQPLQDGDLVVFDQAVTGWLRGDDGVPRPVTVGVGSVGVVLSAMRRGIDDSIGGYDDDLATDVSLGRIRLLVNGTALYVSYHPRGRQVRRISRRSP